MIDELVNIKKDLQNEAIKDSNNNEIILDNNIVDNELNVKNEESFLSNSENSSFNLNSKNIIFEENNNNNNLKKELSINYNKEVDINVSDCKNMSNLPLFQRIEKKSNISINDILKNDKPKKRKYNYPKEDNMEQDIKFKGFKKGIKHKYS